jgi:hypothetical protein
LLAVEAEALMAIQTALAEVLAVKAVEAMVA